jgi:hypothetical protein
MVRILTRSSVWANVRCFSEAVFVSFLEQSWRLIFNLPGVA